MQIRIELENVLMILVSNAFKTCTQISCVPNSRNVLPLRYVTCALLVRDENFFLLNNSVEEHFSSSPAMHYPCMKKTC